MSAVRVSPEKKERFPTPTQTHTQDRHHKVVHINAVRADEILFTLFYLNIYYMCVRTFLFSRRDKKKIDVFFYI